MHAQTTPAPPPPPAPTVVPPVPTVVPPVPTADPKPKPTVDPPVPTVEPPVPTNPAPTPDPAPQPKPTVEPKPTVAPVTSQVPAPKPTTYTTVINGVTTTIVVTPSQTGNAQLDSNGSSSQVQSIVIAVVAVVLVLILVIAAVFCVKRSRKKRDIAYRPDVYTSESRGLQSLPAMAAVPPETPHAYQDANGYLYNDSGDVQDAYGYEAHEEYDNAYDGHQVSHEYDAHPIDANYNPTDMHQVNIKLKLYL